MTIIEQIEDARRKALAAFYAWRKTVTPENFRRWREAQAVEQSLRAIDHLMSEGKEKETPP